MCTINRQRCNRLMTAIGKSAASRKSGKPDPRSALSLLILWHARFEWCSEVSPGQMWRNLHSIRKQRRKQRRTVTHFGAILPKMGRNSCPAPRFCPFSVWSVGADDPEQTNVTMTFSAFCLIGLVALALQSRPTREPALQAVRAAVKRPPTDTRL